jgi:hypothetical protein
VVEVVVKEDQVELVVVETLDLVEQQTLVEEQEA